MKKNIIREKTDIEIRISELGWNYLDDTIDHLNRIRNMFKGQKVYLDLSYCAYSESDERHIVVKVEREETDEEYQERIAKEAQVAQNRIEAERAEFERLSKIYGNK